MTGRELIQWIILNEAMDLEVLTRDDCDALFSVSPRIGYEEERKSHYYYVKENNGNKVIVL